ncbi:arylamine N-acetyltransferase family protein [Hazenella coriacea]|uniref:N-hydroxyarylamine O-acetyltransferase n=1 Tax=Hazenella coriacea TaxID=1179467 RepID=A0A4R3LAA4_9BACL|nr:arylamine N-acetyltransferase [Hazenella coriacea]TCS96773.1 N-hydroxyarylamine O-acetyltransferase [Hazenella coriacea]
MNVSTYLNLIGIQSVGRPDQSVLSLLQENHLLHVPFENLDISLQRPIRLSLPDLYEKIVGQRRGGFCYELNGLFDWLLRESGFITSLISARVRRKDSSFGPEFDHLALLVHLDQPYLVDVGFGDSCRHPLPLTGEEIEDISGRYRVISDHVPEEYVLQKQIEGDWISELRFTTHPYELQAFTPMCEYHQTSPASSFTQRKVCTIATPEGRVTLTQDFMTITRGEQKQKSPILSESQFHEELQHLFGITL